MQAHGFADEGGRDRLLDERLVRLQQRDLAGCNLAAIDRQSARFYTPEVAIDGDALQEINRLMTVSRVFSNAAHDLNNALQVIGGNAELLALKAGPADPRRVQAISTQTGRAAGALDRLMSYTRPAEAGRQALDLEGLVEVALALRDFTLHRARITVTVARTSPTACVVSADRRLLLQIVLNLLLNAEHALSARNDGTAALRIGLAKETGECVVSFADNGPGFSADALARLGDRTVPPPLTATLSGLGLWVASRIAGHHRGGLDVGNAPGQGGGAIVTLRLPAIP